MNLKSALMWELRSAAWMLMHELHYANKNGVKAERLGPGGNWHGVGRVSTSLPANLDSIDSASSPVIAELKPICNILRRQIVNHGFLFVMRGIPARREPIEGFYEYDQADLDALREALNLPVSEVDCGYINHSTDRPCYLMASGSALRVLADSLMRFTYMLVRDWDLSSDKPVLGLHEYNPIAVCPHCDGLFLKAKTSQKHCSTNCRVAEWGKKQGKEYFRVKQAEYRATVKEQEERLKANQKSQTRKKK